jgi:hypothetical protein
MDSARVRHQITNEVLEVVRNVLAGARKKLGEQLSGG